MVTPYNAGTFSGYLNTSSAVTYYKFYYPSRFEQTFR